MKNRITNHLTFLKWDTKRQWTLYLGIVYIVLMCSITIWTWEIRKEEYFNVLNNLSQDQLYFLYSNNLIISPLALFWKVTLTFTWISNFLMGFSIILFAIYPKNWKTQRLMHLNVSYISITFLVFWGLIFLPAILQGNIAVDVLVSTTIVHFVTPALGMFIFIWNKKNINTSNKTIFFSSVAMILYYLFALAVFLVGKDFDQYFIKFNSDGLYHSKVELSIYPFANFVEPLFYKGGNIFVIVTLDIAILLALCSLSVFLAWFWQKVCKLPKENPYTSNFLKNKINN
ncbi:MAGa3780 family membrane protein [Mycoplasmopsis columboralis]|uniref:Uncharacterized protein n=1 Tax=Mycoplasmopsis columboralis TaxID=171282 RepID=A0A449B6W4_9BACT|nr:hypothetical protein [Mycoplasmopsis columboralis]VEU76295.1 Uncharacterised protein [Mycoplasmopsis columboralis]